MPPIGHAILGASSAHRWINCPGSVKLSEGFPNTTSVYAEAGTVAHALCELKVRYELLHQMTKEMFTVLTAKEMSSEYYEQDMQSSSDTYLDFIREEYLRYPQEPFVALEQRVDYSNIVPKGFGTADCIMIGGDLMTICDYKNGAGVLVEADENPQLMLYAIGALNTFSLVYGDSIKRVKMCIIQPNAGGIRTWETTVDALMEWAKAVAAPAAVKALSGEGEPNCGEWCRFCPARAQCRCRAETMLALGRYNRKKPALLSDEELGGIIREGEQLDKWVKEVKEYALTAALDGRAIGGMKVVEGRGSRDWVPNAFAALTESGIPEAVLYERKPVSVAALEKSLGKKNFAQYADLVEKKPGKPALVPESDKRPAYNPAAVAFKEV